MRHVLRKSLLLFPLLLLNDIHAGGSRLVSSWPEAPKVPFIALWLVHNYLTLPYVRICNLMTLDAKSINQMAWSSETQYAVRALNYFLLSISASE